MAYGDDDQDQDPTTLDDSSTISPLQMLMGAGFSTVTPEGKAQAAKIFQELYNKRGTYASQEQTDYDQYEQQAQQARVILQKAREQLAARKTPTNKWLEMAQGFGAPTRTGAFGESLSNYATARIPGRKQEQEWEDQRTKDLLGYDQGINTLDQNLALNRLKMRQMNQSADDKLMIEAMKLMGKPTPLGKTPTDPKVKAQNYVDAAYAKDYLDFIQSGAANQSADIAALAGAARTLKGQKLDKDGNVVQGTKPDAISGPLVGLVPKILRDVILPKSSATQEDVESVAQKSMRLILGPQFTATEGVNLLARVFNPRFEEGVNARRVDRLLSQIQRAYAEKQRAAHYFEQNGTLRGYKGRTSWSLDMFDPDSPTSPLDIDVSQLAPTTPGAPAPAPAQPGPQEDHSGDEDIPIEALTPAQARGGRVAFAEGGEADADPNANPEVRPDGRIRYVMPDGQGVLAKPGQSYEYVSGLYNARRDAQARLKAAAAPQAGTPAPQQRPVAPPQGVMPATDQQEDPEDSYTSRVVSELPTTLGMTAAGAAGAGTAALLGPKALDVTQDTLARVPGVRRVVPRRTESPAEKRINDMLLEQGRTPEELVRQVQATQRMGIPGMVMDDPGIRPLADSALGQSGAVNARDVLARLNARSDQAGERITDQINRGLVPDEYFDQLEKLNDNLYTNAKPLYAAAYANNPAVKSQVLYQLLKTPDGKKAVKTAVRIMANEGKPIGKADISGMVRNPSLEFLDNVKRGFDQLITKEEGSGVNYQPTALGKSMRDLRNAFKAELDQATSGDGGLYAKAREQYEGDLEIRDALREGREDFLKMQPKELQKKWDNLSFSAKDAYRSGVAQRLFEMIGTPSNDQNFAQKIIGSPIMASKLRVMFDTPKKFELFRTALEKEAELYSADRSSVARAQAGAAAHAEPGITGLRAAVKDVPRLGWKSPVMWALNYIRNSGKSSEGDIDEVLKHLKASTPQELADFQKTLGTKMSRRVSRRGRAGKVAAAGAAAAGLAAAAGADVFGDDDNAE